MIQNTQQTGQQEGSITILVADDDREIRELVAALLRDEGYRVITAENGEEAVRDVLAYPVSLVIMDIMMPKVNGLLATMRLREKSNVPVLVLSAKSEQDDRVLGLSVGADDYLTKPFYGAELIARVQALLRRYLSLGSVREEGSREVLRYEELELNLIEKKCLVRGREVKLTATEYRIFKLLMERPKRVWSAEEIYEAVWKEDAYQVENTVMIHISRLREKIEVNPKKPEYIKVVWGIGYKLERE